MSGLPPVRVAIIDDEPDARHRIRALLADSGDVDVVAECTDGADALRTLAELASSPLPVDLIFLDVQMPELDGFAVLEGLTDLLGAESLPVVIFVTAFDQYALRAFDVSAVDYLLKPFDRERFSRALERGVARVRASDKTPEAVRDVVAAARRVNPLSDRFVVRRSGRLYFVKVSEVDWADAEGNYVRLHTASGTHLIRDTLTGVESRLDPAQFVRVHRSAVVNVDAIASLEPYFHGEYVLTLKDGSKLTSSRTYSGRLRSLFR